MHPALKSTLLALLGGLTGAALSAQPAPILPGYNADPAIRIFGDTYYLYPTTDKPRWSSREFSVWSSRDLIHWENRGVILNLPRDVRWDQEKAWAPDCIERNGTYYFYFGANEKIGVATATSPTGPFRDALGRPLLQSGDSIHLATIAPRAFIDDDGQAYLYYGNSQDQGFIQVVPLNQDMITVQGAPLDIPIPSFREGIVVFKREGKYYFMWTSVDQRRSQEISYGRADSPLGPVFSPESNPVVLKRTGPVTGVGYHDVINIPGTDRWYLVYTRWAIPKGAGDRREVCLARLEFNPDGTIRPIDPLAPVFPEGSPGEPLGRSTAR